MTGKSHGQSVDVGFGMPCDRRFSGPAFVPLHEKGRAAVGPLLGSAIGTRHGQAWWIAVRHLPVALRCLQPDCFRIRCPYDRPGAYSMIRTVALMMVYQMSAQAVAQTEAQDGVSIAQGRPIEISGPYKSVEKAFSAIRSCGDKNAVLVPSLIDHIFNVNDSNSCIRKWVSKHPRLRLQIAYVVTPTPQAPRASDVSVPR
jgi:hypothetical protein